jgi:hypothetical protein
MKGAFVYYIKYTNQRVWESVKVITKFLYAMNKCHQKI